MNHQVTPYRTEAQRLYAVRQSPLYMAHTKKDTMKMAKEFTAAMLGTLVEPLAESMTNNPFMDEEETISMDFMKEEVAAMWGRLLAEGRTFDGIKKPIQQALERATHARELQQALQKQAPTPGAQVQKAF